jgi:hypothetical protein
MKKNHEGADLFIPILIPAIYQATAEKNHKTIWPIQVGKQKFFIGMILIQIKNGANFSNHLEAAVNLLPTKVFRREKEREIANLPAFGILMHLRGKRNLLKGKNPVYLLPTSKTSESESESESSSTPAAQELAPAVPVPVASESSSSSSSLASAPAEKVAAAAGQPMKDEGSFAFTVLYKTSIPRLTGLDPFEAENNIQETLLQIASDHEWPVPKIAIMPLRRNYGISFPDDLIEKRKNPRKGLNEG